ncbi:hypothetical protein [Dyella sp. M7H15-1]|nr:hypothetical protein [Dyella sp. M7H15-1]
MADSAAHAEGGAANAQRRMAAILRHTPDNHHSHSDVCLRIEPGFDDIP